MYGRLPAFVFGFHGCDKAVCESIVNGNMDCLKQSTNDYDWLGTGIYFWENDPQRALGYAQYLKDNPLRNHQDIKEPAVIGAAIDLGYCFNLMESESLASLKSLVKKSYTGVMRLFTNSPPSPLSFQERG